MNNFTAVRITAAYTQLYDTTRYRGTNTRARHDCVPLILTHPYASLRLKKIALLIFFYHYYEYIFKKKKWS
jgi:hypothetical protein